MASLRSSAKTASAKSFATASKMKERVKKTKKKATERIIDDIDLDLYGAEIDEDDDDESEEEEADVDMEDSQTMNGDVDVDITMDGVQSTAKATVANPEGHSVQATHWCLIYRTDGALEVSSMDRTVAVEFPESSRFL